MIPSPCGGVVEKDNASGRTPKASVGRANLNPMLCTSGRFDGATVASAATPRQVLWGQVLGTGSGWSGSAQSKSRRFITAGSNRAISREGTM
jgi:hypothetical protein